MGIGLSGTWRGRALPGAGNLPGLQGHGALTHGAGSQCPPPTPCRGTGTGTVPAAVRTHCPPAAPVNVWEKPLHFSKK